MSDSQYPSQTSNDELKAMLHAVADSQAKQSDKIVEILVRQKGQDEKLVSFGSIVTGLNQRMVTLEGKVERNARQQDELEGDVLREVSVQARKIDALAAETARQSKTLAEQDTKLAEILTWKKAIILLVALAPGVWTAFQWAVEHKQPPAITEQHK